MALRAGKVSGAFEKRAPESVIMQAEPQRQTFSKCRSRANHARELELPLISERVSRGKGGVILLEGLGGHSFHSTKRLSRSQSLGSINKEVDSDQLTLPHRFFIWAIIGNFDFILLARSFPCEVNTFPHI